MDKSVKIGDFNPRAEKIFSVPTELKMIDIKGRDLHAELGKARILEAVKTHIERDLGKDMLGINFSLSFDLDI